MAGDKIEGSTTKRQRRGGKVNGHDLVVPALASRLPQKVHPVSRSMKEKELWLAEHGIDLGEVPEQGLDVLWPFLSSISHRRSSLHLVPTRRSLPHERRSRAAGTKHEKYYLHVKAHSSVGMNPDAGRMRQLKIPHSESGVVRGHEDEADVGWGIPADDSRAQVRW